MKPVKKVKLKEFAIFAKKKYLDCGWADIHEEDELGFCWACNNGHLEVVKYLLTSHELKDAGHTWIDLHVINELGFRWACENGHLEVVKYLLTSPELIESGHQWADVHARNELGFLWACNQEQWNVVRWLVMDYGINHTPEIEKIIQKHPQAQEYFRAREELQSIQGVLENNGSENLRDLSNERHEGRFAKKAKKL